MPSHLVLSTENYQEETGTIKVDFPYNQDFKNNQVAVANISLYNSFGNVSSVLGNNKFSIHFPNNLGHTKYTFTIPDGFYSMSNFYGFIKEKCDENGLYVNGTNNTKIYQLVLAENSAYQSIIFFKNLPVNASQNIPDNATWTLPNDLNRKPFVDFHTTSLSNIFGFSQTIIGDGTTSIHENDRTPTPRNINSLILTSNLLSDKRGFSQKSDILTAVPIGVDFGSVVTKVFPKLEWTDIAVNQYGFLELKFYDQNLNRVKLLDSNFLIVLAFREKPKK